MTGLDPASDVIVEIATIVTDDELTSSPRAPTSSSTSRRRRSQRMDAVVVRHAHLERPPRRPSPRRRSRLEEAGAATLAFITEHVPEARTVPLCGNSIGTDRRFLAVYLPEIEEYLHYRSVDVSTIKELTRRWYPGALERRAPQGHRPPRPRRHPRVDRRAALVPRQRLPPTPCSTEHLTSRSSRFAAVDEPRRPPSARRAGAGAASARRSPRSPRGSCGRSCRSPCPASATSTATSSRTSAASPSSTRACPGPPSWRALVDRLKQAGYKPQARPHRDRHPLAPRPLRRRRAPARHVRRRGHPPPQLPHLVRPERGRVLDDEPAGDGEPDATDGRPLGPAACRGGPTPRSRRR